MSRRPPATDAELLEVLNLFTQYGTETEVAKRTGRPRGSIKGMLIRAERKGLKAGAVPEPAAPAELSAPDIAVRRLEEQVKTLRTALESTQEHNLTTEIVRKEILGLVEKPFDPPKWVFQPETATSAVIPVLTCSDWHMGEKIDPNSLHGINEFDLEIAVMRVKRLVERTLRLCFDERTTRDYQCAVVNLGGDMVTGDIHEELAQTNELETMPVALYTAEIIAEMIRQLLDGGFKRIFVAGTMGNHGRNTKRVRHKRRAYSNFDWLITQMVERFMKGDERVAFYSSAAVDTRYEVLGHPVTLTHGDATGARGGDGHIGAVGPIVRGEMKMRRNAATVQHPHRFVIQGHWHTTARIKNLIQNGCLIGYNEYAKQELGAEPEPPSQTLLFFAAQYGLVADHTIYVEPKQVLHPGSDAPMLVWRPDQRPEPHPRLLP